MKPEYILFLLVFYFGMLYLTSWITSRRSNNSSFYLGGRKSPWYIVAVGMLGASLSGVTFISVPGWVLTSNFSYLQLVIGYIFGYLVIAYVLLPIYYKLNLTSIYTYLEHRFGLAAYKTGAVLFIISRTIGASFRLFIVGTVLQVAVFDHIGVPFYVTVFITIALIWLYTAKGGISTIIWTDFIQTILLLLAVVLTIVQISVQLDFSFGEMVTQIYNSPLSDTFNFSDWRSETYFFKYFFSGMFITIVMTGLDQDMMQKNLSCRNLKDAQKNVISYGVAFVPINLLFMGLGVLLVMFANANAIPIPEATDQLYPIIATGGYLHPIVTFAFIIGLIAAAYSSADSALTALTTSFTVDILGYNHDKLDAPDSVKVRRWVHLGVSIVMAIVIIVFSAISDQSVISAIFRVAGYTYGPLLGMFAFGLVTKYQVRPIAIPIIGILSPILCYILQMYAESAFDGYKVGYELLMINGAITFIGLYFSRIGKNFSK